jgi:hypothetical protein
MRFRNNSEARKFFAQVRELDALVKAGKLPEQVVDMTLRNAGYNFTLRQAAEGIAQLQRVVSGKLTAEEKKWAAENGINIDKLDIAARAEKLAQVWGVPKSVVMAAMEFQQSEDIAKGVVERRAQYDRTAAASAADTTKPLGDPSRWSHDAVDRAALRAHVENALVEVAEHGEPNPEPATLDLPKDTSLRDTVASAFDNVAAREAAAQ